MGSRLLDYCVRNNIVYSTDANWEKIVREPEFRGTTGPYLGCLYRNARQYVVKHTGIKSSSRDLTSKMLQEYFITVNYKKQSYSKVMKGTIDFYEKNVNRI